MSQPEIKKYIYPDLVSGAQPQKAAEQPPMIKRPEAYIKGKTYVLNSHTKTLTIFPLQDGNAFVNFNKMTETIDQDGNPVWDQLSMIMPISTIKQYAKLLVDNL